MIEAIPRENLNLVSKNWLKGTNNDATKSPRNKGTNIFSSNIAI